MDRQDRFRRDLALELTPYRPILEALVSGRMPPGVFEMVYFEMYANDPRGCSDDVFNVVDGFFADVDSYQEIPHLRDPAQGDLGPDELRERARRLLDLAGFPALTTGADLDQSSAPETPAEPAATESRVPTPRKSRLTSRRTGGPLNERAVQSLATHVTQLLRVGKVGLYEFLWLLRGDHPEVPASEYRVYAAAALEHLMATGRVRLVWELWGDPTYQRDAGAVVITDEHWDDPTDEPFLALVRTKPGRAGR